MREGLAVAIKYSPAPAAAATAAVEGDHAFVDPVLLVAIAIGLVAGVMWRAAKIHADHGGWSAMRSDLFSSLLSFVANGILALMIIQWQDWGMLPALGVGTIVGATGVRALQWAQAEFFGWLEHRIRGPKGGD